MLGGILIHMTTKKTYDDYKREWPLVDRFDGRIEILCPHGIGHPSKPLSTKDWKKWMAVHGCDGCCSHAAFAIAELAHQGLI
jgi:hypothetical protein